MLRDVVRIVRDPLGFLDGCRREFGPITAFPTRPTRAWMVDEPACVDRILRTNAANYSKDTVQYGTLSLLTGSGLLTADDPGWRTRRRRVAPAFHRRTLQRLLGCVQAAADGVDTGLDTQPDQLADLLTRAALDVVSRGLFSAQLDRTDQGDIADAVLDGLTEVIRRASRPLRAPRSWPTPGNRQLTRSLRTLDDAVLAVIAGRSGSVHDEPDVLDLLMAAIDDPAAIRDEAVTLVVAGHETVASALQWACHLLAVHPVWQDRVATETADLPAAMTIGDLARLPVTRAVLEETLRLYPPAWVITRRAIDDDELAGYRLPAGTVVIVSPWVRHRDPVVWPEPLRFAPERFLGDADSRPTPNYLPFGAGPRLCIGRDFALLEATVLLGRLVSRWRLEPAPGHAVRPEVGVTVRPSGGLKLMVTRRRDPGSGLPVH